MTKPLAILAVAFALGACTLTNAKDEPVVLTAANAPSLILAQMRKGCPDLIAAGNVAVALAKALQAAESTQGTVNLVSNMASIGCSLLVPPPPVVVAVDQPAASLPVLK